jgi:hypothetical protein
MSAKLPANLPALRLGVVLGGTVVAEHLVRDGRPFTLGRSAAAVVQLPLPGLPRRWELLRLTPAGLVLRLGAGMDARVSIGDAVWTRAECDARGQRRGDTTEVTVPLAAHGRVDVGEVRVLFQGVRLPAPAPTPTLPRALKGTLVDRIDGRVAALAAASLVAHLGLTLAAHLNDPPGDPTPAAKANTPYVEDTVAILDADDPIFADPAPTAEPPPADPGPATAPTPRPTEPTAPTTGPRRPSGPATGPAAPSLDPQADAARLADLLFASDGDAGKLRGDLSDRRAGTDLAQQLDELAAKDGTASIGDQSGRTLPAPTGPQLGTAQEPVITPPTNPVTPIVKDPERSPPGRIDPVRLPQPPGDPDVRAVLRKIESVYVSGLQRCYKKALVGDQTLAGKVTLSFTVTERGTVSDAKASGVDDGLVDCIRGTMAKWTFTPVVDEDGDATEVDLKMALQLRPN